MAARARGASVAVDVKAAVTSFAASTKADAKTPTSAGGSGGGAPGTPGSAKPGPASPGAANGAGGSGGGADKKDGKDAPALELDRKKLVAGVKANKDFTDELLEECGEPFIIKGKLYENVKQSEWVFLVTNKSMFKFPADIDPRGTKEFRKKKSLMDIHTVEQDPADPSAFYMYAYKSKAKFASVKMMGAVGAGMDFSQFLQTRHFRCSSELECFQWVTVFNKLVRDLWQLHCEATVVPSPEVYQGHAFVIKLNRRGVAQDRCLVLSSDWLYNVECSHNPTAITGKPKWAVPVRALKAVSIHRAKEGQSNASVTFYLDVTVFKKLLDKAHTGSKGDDMNDSHTFIFRDDIACNRFAAELRRCHYYAAGKQKVLNVEVKEEFATAVAGSAEAAHSVKAAAGDGPVLSSPLTKFIKDGKGSHTKHFALYPSAMIEWREDPKDAKAHREQVVSVSVGIESLKNKKLTAAEVALVFTIQTTGKTLHLMGPTKDDRDKWVKAVEDILGRRGHTGSVTKTK